MWQQFEVDQIQGWQFKHRKVGLKQQSYLFSNQYCHHIHPTKREDIAICFGIGIRERHLSLEKCISAILLILKVVKIGSRFRSAGTKSCLCISYPNYNDHKGDSYSDFFPYFSPPLDVRMSGEQPESEGHVCCSCVVPLEHKCVHLQYEFVFSNYF